MIDSTIAQGKPDDPKVEDRILTSFEETSISGVGGDTLPYIKGINEVGNDHLDCFVPLTSTTILAGLPTQAHPGE